MHHEAACSQLTRELVQTLEAIGVVQFRVLCLRALEFPLPLAPRFPHPQYPVSPASFSTPTPAITPNYTDVTRRWGWGT